LVIPLKDLKVIQEHLQVVQRDHKVIKEVKVMSVTLQKEIEVALVTPIQDQKDLRVSQILVLKVL
jgi:hypothetical protein